MSILELQSSWWGRESWLLCLICLPGVSWWLSGSSSRCHGVVCSLWLWYFLIILTYYFWRGIENWLFAFIVLQMYCYYKCSVALPHGAVGWSAVCDCGISWSYSLTFCSYITQFLRSWRLFKMTIYQPWQFISHLLCHWWRQNHGFDRSGADIIWFIVMKRQDIMLAGIQLC